MQRPICHSTLVFPLTFLLWLALINAPLPAPLIHSEAAGKGQTPPTPRAAQRRGMRSLIPSLGAGGRS